MNVTRITLLMLLVVCLPLAVIAQTATTATVSGVVTDPQGAVVAGATVKLTDTTTNTERTATTDAEGRYNFYALAPGTLKLTVTASGFKTKIINDVQAEVTKVTTVNATLELGEIGAVVQVSAGTEAALQTSDASVGNVFPEERLQRLPVINRQVNALFNLQPATTPTGQFAGARNDQSTINLDGVDVTDNVLGQTGRTVIPVPIETVEEFRGTVVNANATFGRSSGGQQVLVTKTGSNNFHGSLYLFHKDNALASNTWTLNRLNSPKPFFIDNRFGGSLGGPIIKNKTFFFFNYEGQRNPNTATVTRVVPTETLKAGILRFRDTSAGGAGVIRSYDANAIRAFDPRSIGVNTLVSQYLNLYPVATDTSVGDGLNTAGFTFTAPLQNRNDFALLNLTHKFNERWTAGGKFSASRILATNAGQVDLRRRAGLGDAPARPRNIVGTLTGVLSPNITNEARFSWVHDRLEFGIVTPQTFAGINLPINLGGTVALGGVLDDVMDVDSQRARHQFRTINTYQWSDTLTWIKGSHNIQAGANIRRIRSVDFRDDKVIGSISTPVADIGTAGGLITIPSAQRPPTCSATVTDNCIRSADVGRYNELYASLLGLVGQVPALFTRDASLNLQPLGTGLLTRSTLKTWEFFVSDTWRWKPSFTVTYGLTYNWQEPPIEDSGKQTVLTFKDTGKLVNFKEYMLTKQTEAEAGRVYNPQLAYVPINQAGRKTAFDTDFSNFSPRLSVAWNPSFTGKWLGGLFGDRKTVIRGGYSLVFDRTNTVQTITIPTLGVGFAQTYSVRPTNAQGQTLRLGEAPLPLPTAPATVTSPVVPAPLFGETLSFSVDPFIKVPRNHVVDFTVQRELPWRMIMEVGYIGRFARNLYADGNLNAVPFMHKDAVSGQTFAQAFDAVATALRGGTAASSITPQPYFENIYGAGFTRTAAAAQTSAFINGNVSSLTQFYLDLQGRPALTNQQVQELFVRFSGARSNYHGMVVTLRKRFSQGLSFDANYTLSKSLDESATANQNGTGQLQTSFFHDYSYAPSLFDIRHLLNINGTYELPFGNGKHWSSSNRVVNKIVGGWFIGSIFQYQSGLPLNVQQSAQAFGGGATFGPATGAIPLTHSTFDPSLHAGVMGSGGFGTNGDPARGGSGFNLFADPGAVANSFRRVLLSQDTRTGNGVIRGLGRWQFDLSLGKETKITEKVKFALSVDFLNAFNHPLFANPATNLANPASFGVITTQLVTAGTSQGPRVIQVGGRFSF